MKNVYLQEVTFDVTSDVSFARFTRGKFLASGILFRRFTEIASRGMALTALLVASSIIISGISGCGSNSGEVVAVVNGDPIPLREVENQLKAARMEYFNSLEEELEARKIVTDTLVIQQLLVQEGYKIGLDKSEEVARIALTNKDKFLLDVLYERAIGPDPDISDAQVQDVFDRLEYKFRASHILVATREEAGAVVDSLEAGVPFGRLSHNLSLDRKSAKDQGDLGYFVWGQMDEKFQNAIWKLTPGQISSPVSTRFGWHVINLTEKLPNPERKTFAQMKYALKQDILTRHRTKAVQDYFEVMREKYEINAEPKTIEFLLKKREDLYPPLILDRLPRGDFDLEQLDRDEKALPIATWDGGQISIGEYLVQIRNVSTEARPDFDDYEGIAELVFRMKFNDILGLEARRIGLESSDEFKQKMKRFRELTMAEIMRDSLPEPPPPDDDQLLAYYTENTNEFTTPARVHLIEILVSDSKQALTLRRSLKGIKGFKQAASELTERGGKRATRGDLGLIERKWFPAIFDVAQRIPIGGIGGPVETLGKWSIFYVADKIAEDVKAYDQVRRQINNKIIRTQKAEAFRSWVENVKKASDITRYDNVIEDSIDPDKYPEADIAS